MSDKFLRIYKKFNVGQIKEHLLIYGDLSGSCAKCNRMDVRLEDHKCSGCGTEFEYISFRHVKSHLPKMQRLAEDRPQVVFIDYDDYQKAIGALKAEQFLK